MWKNKRWSSNVLPFVLCYNVSMGKIIGITDIHGEYDKLVSLIGYISPTKDDTIVFMGDYIDRGKKSKEVVDKVISMSDICHCIYLIGSHEYAMMHSKTDEYYDYLFWNYGGDATADSYGGFENIMKIHGDFFNSLKFYHIIGKYLFVHAGLRNGIALENQDEVDMVYIRGNFYNYTHDFPYRVIFGHTEFDKPQIWQDKICIDTGCGKYKDAPLTAIVIEGDNELFVNSFGESYNL